MSRRARQPPEVPDLPELRREPGGGRQQWQFDLARIVKHDHQRSVFPQAGDRIVGTRPDQTFETVRVRRLPRGVRVRRGRRRQSSASRHVRSPGAQPVAITPPWQTGLTDRTVPRAGEHRESNSRARDCPQAHKGCSHPVESA